MSRFHSYILSATKIIETYRGEKPLVYHLKNFFAAEKKYGSRDRKQISALCYAYFRLGFALKNKSIEERILSGTLLCEQHENELLKVLKPAWNERVQMTVSDKMSFLQINETDIFPFASQLGSVIDFTTFVHSFFTQPFLYLRIRPGKMKQVTSKLSSAGIDFSVCGESCLQLANSLAIDKILDVNREVVVQDYNSQRVFDFIHQNPLGPGEKAKVTVWDCCAASGGKSILLYDLLQVNLRLTVSDVRESILKNLVTRLGAAGINVYNKFIVDLTEAENFPRLGPFSIIICDVPCTGSGTWARTPEQLLFFEEEQINVFAERQKKITSNVIPFLEADGLFFYITCSVFKEENEFIVQHIKQKFNMQLLHMEYLDGYKNRADNLFVAVFRK